MKVHKVGPGRPSILTAIVSLFVCVALGSAGHAAPPSGPQVPTGVVATALSTSSIRVTWSDTNADESGYQVERSLSSGSGFVLVHTSGANATAFTNSGLQANTRYYYRVRAVVPQSGKNKPPLYSDYSQTVSAQTFALTTTSTTPAASTTSTSTPISTTTSTTLAGGNLPPVANAGANKSLAVGQTGTFDGRASYDPDGSIVAYLWNFGDGGVWGNSSVELRSYASSGTYTVTLYVQDNKGTWSSDTLIVTVGGTATTTSTSSTTTTTVGGSNQLPVANAGPDKTLGVGQVGTFDGRGSYDPDGSIVSYLWDFGDGGVWGDSSVESRSYSSVGTYTVRLYVKDNAGIWTSDTAIVTVQSGGGTTSTSTSTTSSTAQANAAPVALAGPDKQATVGQSVSFDGRSSYDPDGTIVAYAWNFGDGGTAGTALTSHAWASAGTYTVLLYVQDDDGAWSTDTAVVTVTSSTSGGEWLGRETGSSSQQTTGVAKTGTGDVIIGGFSNGTLRIGGLSLSGVDGRIDGYVAKYGATGTVAWARQLRAGNSSSPVVVEEVAGDATGNVYAAGRFSGSMTVEGTTLTSAGLQDLFVVKYGPTGSLLWARRYGGTLDDVAYAVAVDGGGNVYVTGFYTGTVNFGGGALSEPKITPTPTVYVLKLSASGAHTWSRSIDGTAYETGWGLAIAPNGDIVIVGTFNGGIDFGGGQFWTLGATDGFVAQLTPTGQHRWARQVGGSNTEAVVGVATDGNGNVAVAGRFRGTASFGGSAFSANGTVSDVFVASYTGAGAYRWARQAGGWSGEDTAHGLATDDAGTVYVTGSFMDTATFGTSTLTSQGGRDMFVASYGATGTYRGADAWGGTDNEESLAIAAWGTGQVASGGYFRGTAVIAGQVVTTTGSSDGFTARENR